MRLSVFIGDRHIGDLDHDPETNRFAFAYAPEWLGWLDRFPLAPPLPLEPEAAAPDAHSAVVRQFFENLLPEGQALDDAAAAGKVSKANVVGLLAMLGKETAGALRIIPPDAAREPAPATLRPLAREEVSRRIRERPAQPFSVWDGRVRLSITGYQDKVAVYSEGDQWFIADGEPFASTHIVKPEPLNEGLRGMTSNEFFCLRLARHVGLAAAQATLVHVPEPVLVVTRFDRRTQPGRVERIHIIDGCQALGLPVGSKYERPYGDGRDVADQRTGASLPRLFAMLRTSPRPLVNRDALLRWVIFQVLIGNADAHAKNLSFFVTAAGFELAPMYDVVCVHALPETNVSKSYALAIGDAFSAEQLSPFEWATFARACGLPPALVGRELTQLAAKARDALPVVRDQVMEEGADAETVRRVSEAVEALGAAQAAMGPEVDGVPKDLL